MSLPTLHCIGHITLDTFLLLENAELNCDINHKNCKICFEFGSKIPVKETHYAMGGGAANVSIGVKKLGLNTQIYSTIGNDPKGLDIKEGLLAGGVDISHLAFDNNPTDQSTVAVFSNERTIFTYAYPRNLKINIDSAEYIYLSSVGGDVSHAYSHIKNIMNKSPKPKLFYNPGSRELKFAMSEVLNLIECVDYLIINVEEACSILDPSLNRDDVEINDLLNLLIHRGAENVVMTDGENGVYSLIDGKYLFMPSEKVRVIEKTGAGDAFTSGFVSGVMYGLSPKISIQRGIKNSASAITKIGAQNGLLGKEEMESLLDLAG